MSDYDETSLPAGQADGELPEVTLPELTSAEQLWEVDDHEYDWVTVPEWGMRVRVRGMSGTERDAWEGQMADARKPGSLAKDWSVNQRAKMVARCVVDREGQRIFNSADVIRLGEKSARGLDRVFDVARRLSGLTQEDLDELAGNSSGEPSAENGSGSPSHLASL